MRRNKLLQAGLVLVVAFCLFRFGIRPPMPYSVLSLYMAITLMAVLVYVSSDADSWRAFVTPIWRTLTAPSHRPIRLGLGILIPLLLGYYAYTQAAARSRRRRPSCARCTRRRPARSSFRGQGDQPPGADNPLRKDVKQTPANREKHVPAGGEIYIRNCIYCHGDNLDGKGHFAHGFNPPAGRTSSDPGTIAHARRRPTCSGASPRAARACRRNRRPGTRSCRPGRTASPRSRSGR